MKSDPKVRKQLNQVLMDAYEEKYHEKIEGDPTEDGVEEIPPEKPPAQVEETPLGDSTWQVCAHVFLVPLLWVIVSMGCFFKPFPPS